MTPRLPSADEAPTVLTLKGRRFYLFDGSRDRNVVRQVRARWRELHRGRCRILRALNGEYLLYVHETVPAGLRGFYRPQQEVLA